MHLLSAKGMHARVLREAPDGGLDLNVLRQALHAKDRRKNVHLPRAQQVAWMAAIESVLALGDPQGS
jgi:hypothetical protein